MKKKAIIKIIIAAGAAVLIGIIALLVIKIKKPDELRLGMSQEMVESIVHKNKYNYAVSIPDYLYAINEPLSINHVKGYYVFSFYNHKLDNIQFVAYLYEIGGYGVDSIDEQNRKVDLLKKYLNKKYGEPIEKGTDRDGYLTMIYEKRDMNIKITYPEEDFDGSSITVDWYFKEQ